jgi:hypothetical protein
MTQKFYIEAYAADDSPLLGNLDGQGVIYAEQYRRTNMYRSLRDGHFMKRVAYHLIRQASTNRVIERIDHV